MLERKDRLEREVVLDESTVAERSRLISQTPVVAAYNSTLGKRVFDIVGVAVIGILTAPIFIIIVAAIRFGGAPAIFPHGRIGRGGEEFKCYKFRTMVQDAEAALPDLLETSISASKEWAKYHKLRDDPRVTRLGRFLRKSSLDELPQLWNVVRGDMSLVGPRPIVSDELARYGSKASNYCAQKPGITGLWQVMGRSEITYSRRVSMDVLYGRKQSLLVDSWILLKTVVVVFNRVGAS